ncbi:MAG: hypothetical protein DWH78_04135 [Planctomycetota bacterium]|nr:MAG: hypothetical protein DWH78_04135 [Planctomycetota bacterium]
MLTPTVQYIAHSATVAATLIIGEQRIPLTKVSPNALYFASGHSFEPSLATVELEVDGKIRNLSIRVLHPVVPFVEEVAIRQV